MSNKQITENKSYFVKKLWNANTADEISQILTEYAQAAIKADREDRWISVKDSPNDGKQVLIMTESRLVTFANFHPLNKYWIKGGAKWEKNNDGGNVEYWFPYPELSKSNVNKKKQEISV